MGPKSVPAISNAGGVDTSRSFDQLRVSSPDPSSTRRVGRCGRAERVPKGTVMAVIKGICVIAPAVLLTAAAVIGVGASLALSSWDVV